MFRKVLRFICIVPILMAFQCDDEMENQLRFNPYKVNITPNATFSLDDTILITARVSSKVYDLSTNDSIFNEDPNKIFNQFTLFKLIEPINTRAANTEGAIDKFDLIYDIGDYSPRTVCENTQKTIFPELNNDNSLYTYRIGLKPLVVGDYIINWPSINSAIVQNENRNESIIENYQIENRPNQIEFNQCGNRSVLFINETERIYFFSIR